MKLEWLDEYRDLVEKIIKYGNSYSKWCKVEIDYGSGIKFSPAQLQVMEYILENEDGNQTMNDIAKRLGISQSAFSKNVKRMVEKRLLSKRYSEYNHKNVIIEVTEAGREAYEVYAENVYHNSFKKLFDILDEIPREYIDKFTHMMDLASGNSET